MSTPSTHPPAQCDRLIEFVYGELDGAEREAFATHLASCEACQREHAIITHVRGALKTALPMVEPPPVGGLHAQLMHAAATRKPARGQVVPLFRRVLFHPGFAAAASFLVIGGVVGTLMIQNRGAMPMPEHAAAPVMAPPAGMAPAERPAPAPQPEFDKLAEEKLDVKAPASPPAYRASPPKMKAMPAKDRYGKGGILDDPFGDSGRRADSDALGAIGGAGSSYESGSSLRGAGTSGAGPQATRVQQAPAKPAPKSTGGRAFGSDEDLAPPASPAPATQAAPQGGYAVRAPEPARERSETKKRSSARAPADSKSAMNAMPIEQQVAKSEAAKEQEARVRGDSQTDGAKAVAQRAVAQAARGDCASAVQSFLEIEKRYPGHTLSSSERLEYARCLRTTDQVAAAQRQLDVLRRDKNASQTAVAQEEALLSRRRAAPGKNAAGKPPTRAAPATAADKADALGGF